MMRQNKWLCSFALVAALSMFAACDSVETPTDTDTSNTSKTGTTTPVSIEDNEKKPSFFPYNNPSVKEVPPKPFTNHWTPATAQKPKKAPLQVFLSRTARRMSLDKLKATIPYLFGGITWTDSRNRNMFDQLSLTLGKADYIEVTKNNNEVTKLFMKLMDDMATNVCKKVIPADAKKAESARDFARFGSDVNKALRFIRLKFHGVFVASNSTAEIQQLRDLYNKVLAAAKKKGLNTAQATDKAWELVCIATITSPEFFIY